MNMKLSNQGLSSREEFIMFIESIGFKSIKFNSYYSYKEFEIYLHGVYYILYNGSERICDFYYNDLTPFDKYFKNELRSIKLKKILG